MTAEHGLAHRLPQAIGIRANRGQFAVQTLLVFFVGLTVGTERHVVPLLAEREFQVASAAVVFSFVVSFGFVKAAVNLLGGSLSERVGRRPLLIAGWLAAIPVPLMIIWAMDWWMVVAANVLLGINQGLAWSMTVTAKMDIAGERWRGLATGINEFAGYTGLAAAAVITGYLAATFGLRPAPFLFGLAVIVAATLTAVLLAKETRHLAHARLGAMGPVSTAGFWAVFRRVTFHDRTLFAASQAGLFGKVADVAVWVAVPLLLLHRGASVETIGLVAGAFGATWGVGQLATGFLSDQLGRRPFAVLGLFSAGAGLLVVAVASTPAWWGIGAALAGLGMAMHYPALIAVVADASEPRWRGASLGVYRMWRDSGMGFGALLLGFVANLGSIQWSLYVAAGLLFCSGLTAALLLRETYPRGRKEEAAMKRT